MTRGLRGTRWCCFTRELSAAAAAALLAHRNAPHPSQPPSPAPSSPTQFFRDHGWSLGELGEWEKFTLWEHGTRVPLLFRAPWLGAGARGTTVDAPVELVDVMPTVLELAGVPPPEGEVLDGQSLAALVAGTPPPLPPRGHALSVYPRCPANTSDPLHYWRNNDCLMVERSLFFAMGVSLRTPAWRYTEWVVWNGTTQVPNWGVPLLGAELYNHTGDDGTNFDAPYEVVNLAEEPGYAPLRAELSLALRTAYFA